MPRRARKNRDLEANLYQNGEYYQYKHPITGNRISLGKDRKQANAAARIANIRLQKEPDRVAKILGTNDGLSALIDRFESEYLPEKEYAKSSLREIKIKLNLYKNEFAGTSIHAIDVKTLADWLYQFTRASYIKHRLLWIDLFKYAMSQGLVTFNVAEATLYKRPAKRKRDRLTEGVYIPVDKTQTIAQLDDALEKSAAAEPATRKLRAAMKAGTLPKGDPEAATEDGVKAGVITEQEAAAILSAVAARKIVIQVDEFLPEYLTKEHGKWGSNKLDGVAGQSM